MAMILRDERKKLIEISIKCRRLSLGIKRKLLHFLVSNYIVCVKDFDKLRNLIWRFDSRLKQNFATVPATSKIQPLERQGDPKIIVSVLSKSLIHTVLNSKYFSKLIAVH